MTEICDWDDLVQRVGLFCKKFTEVPFTGTVTGKGQGKIINGNKVGPWVVFWSNGQVMVQGNWKNGKRDGPWVWNKPDGTVDKEMTGTYKNGVKISD